MGDEIEVSYRRFIEYIHRKSLEKSIDYDWSCDALMWTYTSVHEFDGNQPALCIALDDGSLFNDSKGNGTAANVDGSYVIDVNNFKIPFGYEYGDNDENEDLIKDLFDSNTGRVVRHGYIHYQNRLRIANCQLLGVTADRDIQPGEGTCVRSSDMCQFLHDVVFHSFYIYFSSSSIYCTALQNFDMSMDTMTMTMTMNTAKNLMMFTLMMFTLMMFTLMMFTLMMFTMMMVASGDSGCVFDLSFPPSLSLSLMAVYYLRARLAASPGIQTCGVIHSILSSNSLEKY
jgi:hypothetical protein